MHYKFHSDAAVDLGSAIEYYNHEREGLGAEFLNEVLATIDHVREFPDACPVYMSDYRRALVKRFPYLVLYRVVCDELRIMAITHLRRNPEINRERLE